jgi:hypothetical protein
MTTLYKPVKIDNLQQIQDAVLKIYTPEQLDKPDLFYMTNEVFLNIPELKSCLDNLGLLSYVHIIATTVMPPGYGVPGATFPNDPTIHIDYGIYTHSLNIPIKNCDNTFVSYHTVNGPPETMHLETNGLPFHYYKPENCVQIDQVEMTQAYIINTSVPHAIVNPTDKTRILIAIRLTSKFNFDEF